MKCPMPQRNDLSRSLVAFRQDGTPVAVAEPRRSSRLVAGTAPGIGRHTLKKLDPSEEALFAPLRRWRDEATGTAGAGRTITRPFSRPRWSGPSSSCGFASSAARAWPARAAAASRASRPSARDDG